MGGELRPRERRQMRRMVPVHFQQNANQNAETVGDLGHCLPLWRPAREAFTMGRLRADRFGDLVVVGVGLYEVGMPRQMLDDVQDESPPTITPQGHEIVTLRREIGFDCLAVSVYERGEASDSGGLPMP